MNEQPVYRKSVRHFNELGHAHALTFSCFNRRPLLARDSWKVQLSRSIEAAAAKQGFDLLAFVYMPEHVHLLIFPHAPDAAVERFLYAVKRPFSFRVKQDLLNEGSPLLHELTVRERPGKMTFRFWQEGPGFDRNLTDPEEVLTVIEYFHNNPVKRGLVERPEQWRWSSWRHFHQPDVASDPDLPLLVSLPF